VFYALNYTDHETYKELIFNEAKFNYRNLTFSNNWGIATIYRFLIKMTAIENVEFLAFGFNSIVIIISYFLFNLIRVSLNLHKFLNLFFIFNPQVVYFSQLIYKEPLTLLLVLLLIALTLKGRVKLALILLPLAFLVRIQLIPMIILSVFMLMNRNRWGLKLFFVYVFTSAVGILYALKSPSIPAVLESGVGFNLVNLYMSLNREYFVGSFVLFPIRIFQYYVDLSYSVFFISNNQVDMYRLRDLPFFFFLSFIGFRFWGMVYNLKTLSKKSIGPAIIVCLVYINVLLILPIIHSRYLFSIFPIFVLVAGYKNESDVNDEDNNLAFKESK